MRLSRPSRGPGPTARLLTPVVACLAASMILATPVRLFGLQAPEPVFGLALAFTWGGQRPSIGAAPALLGLGVCSDLLWGTHTGFWAVLLLVQYGLVLAVRPGLAGQRKRALFGWFLVSSAMTFASGYALERWSGATPLAPMGLALQWGVSAAVFPLVWIGVERLATADERAFF